jgi:hypothetical protein
VKEDFSKFKFRKPTQTDDGKNDVKAASDSAQPNRIAEDESMIQSVEESQEEIYSKRKSRAKRIQSHR